MTCIFRLLNKMRWMRHELSRIESSLLSTFKRINQRLDQDLLLGECRIPALVPDQLMVQVKTVKGYNRRPQPIEQEQRLKGGGPTLTGFVVNQLNVSNDLAEDDVRLFEDRNGVLCLNFAVLKNPGTTLSLNQDKIQMFVRFVTC